MKRHTEQPGTSGSDAGSSRVDGRGRSLPSILLRASIPLLVACEIAFLYHIFVGREARAIEIGCAGSNRNPAACSLTECLSRSAAKDAACNQPRSCQGVLGCAELQSRLAKNEACLAARNFVQGCFFVSEPGHEAAIAQTQNAIATCQRKIALPISQGGCADPCP